jgi:lauroyl/myristoyl acyltransferase/predicted metal-dependent phosphoesterase TrpH
VAEATRSRALNAGKSTAPYTRTDRIVLRGIHVASWVTWAVPWPIWHVVGSVTGMAVMFRKRTRAIAFANIQHVRHKNPPPGPVAWYLGAQQNATHAKTIIGTLQAGVRLPDPTNRLEMLGTENLIPFLGQRGIIIVAPHAGPYPTLGLMANDWLRERGFTGELSIVARLFRPFRSGALMDWFIDCFAKAGARIIPVDQSPLRMASQLRGVLDAKGIVVLFVDEPTPTPSLEIPFFDSLVKLPAGPVRLAQATGSIIVPCVVTFGKGRRVTVEIQPPIEPVGTPAEMLTKIAQALEPLIDEHLDQWAMLTPIWLTDTQTPPPGHSYADLHVHTIGSDGLLEVDAWVDAAESSAVSVLAVTDHDHIATIREWHAAERGARGRRVIPGVEITARGRIVHVGILFPEDVPADIPKPGTPLLDIVRWARSIPGSIVVLVHPLPFLWRGQLHKLAAANLLPDAIETRFPLSGWRTPTLERVASEYGLAVLGGSDAHLMPKQLGQYVTQFPGESVDDLLAAIQARTTRAIARPARAQVPAQVYGLQSIYSWLLPFQRLPLVKRARAGLLHRARAIIAQREAADAEADRVEIASELGAVGGARG